MVQKLCGCWRLNILIWKLGNFPAVLDIFMLAKQGKEKSTSEQLTQAGEQASKQASKRKLKMSSAFHSAHDYTPTFQLHHFCLTTFATGRAEGRTIHHSITLLKPVMGMYGSVGLRVELSEIFETELSAIKP